MVKRFALRTTLVAVAALLTLVVPGCLADKRTLLLAGADGADGDDGGSDSAGPIGPCNPARQSGCATTQKCTLVNNRPSCVADGTKGVRTLCTGTPDNCTRGNLCVAFGPGSPPGMCRQFCERDSDCTQSPMGASNDPHCTFKLSGTPHKVCSTPCNPVVAQGMSGCPSGLACIYGNVDGVLLTDCLRKDGNGFDGDSCTTDEHCAEGLFCATNVCRYYCRNGFNSDCGGSYTCVTADSSYRYGACCPPSPTPC
jgi:hypothetical protein